MKVSKLNRGKHSQNLICLYLFLGRDFDFLLSFQIIRISLHTSTNYYYFILQAGVETCNQHLLNFICLISR